MLRQFKQAYESNLEDEHTLADHVAIYLQSPDVVPHEDLVWIWELLVLSREPMRAQPPNESKHVDTPLTRQNSAVREVLKPFPFSSMHSDMQHLHGLPSVCNVILDVCFATNTAQKVLSILLERLLPEYHVASMGGFRVDWKIVDMALIRHDAQLSRHLSDHNVSIEILCSQWYFSLFSDAMPAAAVTQLYTWVLASARTNKPKKQSNWLITMALALLFFLSDVLQTANDASTIATLLDHFSRQVLMDDDILALFLEWCYSLHLNFDETVESCRKEMQLEESAMPRRIFVVDKHNGHSGYHRKREDVSYEQFHERRGLESDVESAIDKDITRTSNAAEEHWGALRRVLVAFAKRNTQIGYCQGMNEILAVLLRQHMSEDVAFWALVYLVEDVFPDYHSPSLVGLHTDCAVIETLLCQNDPHLVHHLQSLGLNMEVLCTNWLMACFATTTPASFHLRLLDMLFAAESSAAASRVPVVAAVAIILHLSPTLIHQLDTGGVVQEIKQFLSSLKTDPADFLTLCRTLLRQLPPNELLALRRVHLVAVEEKIEAFASRKAALRATKTSGLFKRRFFLSSPPKGASKKERRSLPSFLVRKKDKGSPPEDDESDETKLQSHLLKTMRLLEEEAIDAAEYAHIKDQIVRTWSTMTHTPAHAQARVEHLTATILAPKQTRSSSMYSRQTAKARASLSALSAKWRHRTHGQQQPQKAALSPTALELSEIASSYYGGELTDDQRIARKSELIAKTLFK
ncbi:Aste57867_21221 [Aphanomyces stellatus]|uniref:Aste57867_21221 protein n=1 Tax=Aphanomyces stellatus TaxID=120398 RepID=A0A485LIE2_9STRA|nr:hypothetical protein As57867_021153 [Aphanomyces stellatus]VFT97893.1 Aste57867_21221 [Aphanomyces stellatus]